MRLRSQGDVYIVNPPMLSIGTIVSNGPQNILRGKTIPLGNEVNILFGSYGHTLSWFEKEIKSILSPGDVYYGEMDTIVKCANTNAKAHSNYAIGTDHIFASLHRLFMYEHDASKANALMYLNAIKSLTIAGSTVSTLGDLEIDMWENYFPSQNDASHYILSFLLSSSFRQSQYSYLLEMIKTTGGISAITASDKVRQLSLTIGSGEPRDLVDEALIRITRDLTLEHWYQTMVMERAHAFIEPQICSLNSYSTVQDAAFTLFAIGVDALCFPNLF